MANVRGCNLPDELLYDVENHIWYQETDDKAGRLAAKPALAPGAQVAAKYEAKMAADNFRGCA